jgi:hypothetical protein
MVVDVGHSDTGDIIASEISAMSFALYMLGFIVFLGGVIWGAVVAGVPHVYIGIATLILLGIGIFSAVSKTRAKDPS